MIRLIVSAALLLLGVCVFVISAIGNFRCAFVLNRMQISAIADTMATSCILGGLIVASGLTVTSLKLVIMLLFLWFVNPVASHFLAKTEVGVNKEIEKECEVVRYDNP